MWVRSGLLTQLVLASCAVVPLGVGVPVAHADESTCAAIDQMSKVVDDPANNGPVVTEALMYLRADNPAYSGLDRQVEVISEARDMWGRNNDAVRANLTVSPSRARASSSPPTPTVSPAPTTWREPGWRPPRGAFLPEIIDRGGAVGGLLFDGTNNFHVLANICNGGRR